MRTGTHITTSKTRSFARGSFGYGMVTALGLILVHQGAAAQSAQENTNNAAKSLESILQQAAEDGFLQSKSSETPSLPNKTKKSPSPLTTASNKTSEAQNAGDCKVASRANIMTVADVASLDAIMTAKSEISSANKSSKAMDDLILTYLALGLGTEAQALSERSEAPLQAAMARVDFIAAETILRYYSPETKYGEISERKDDQRLYLQALILRNKDDARATEILKHIAESEGDYQTN